MSRLQEGQLRGSFNVSSGCGSKMIFPLAVFFLSPTKVCSGFWDRRDGEWKTWRDPGLDAGGYGEGRVEPEVLAGAMSTPRGSLRPVSLDNSRTDPARRTHVSNALSNSNPKPTYQVPHLSLCRSESPWSIFPASFCVLQHHPSTPENALFPASLLSFARTFSIHALPRTLLLFQPCQKSAMLTRAV